MTSLQNEQTIYISPFPLQLIIHTWKSLWIKTPNHRLVVFHKKASKLIPFIPKMWNYVVFRSFLWTKQSSFSTDGVDLENNPKALKWLTIILVKPAINTCWRPWNPTFLSTKLIHLHIQAIPALNKNSLCICQPSHKSHNHLTPPVGTMSAQRPPFSYKS